jgi:hypothetical protein
LRELKNTKPSQTSLKLGFKDGNAQLGVVFCFEHFAATVKASWADVVTQMNFACYGLNACTWRIQCIVSTVHTAFRRRFFVLLNSHDELLEINFAKPSIIT